VVVDPSQIKGSEGMVYGFAYVLRDQEFV